MGYEASKCGKNNSRWRVRERTYEKDREIWRSVKLNQYAGLGIRKDMTLDEVRAALGSINANAELVERERNRAKVQVRLDQQQLVECAHLPTIFVQKFETDHLPTRYLGNEARLVKVKQHWRAAQEVIRLIERPIEQWHRYPEPFYAYFTKHAYSPGYVDNVMSILNRWVDYLGIEQDKFYRPVPAPSSSWAAKLADAFEESGDGKASLPLTPEMLQKAQKSEKMKFSLPHYNWLYCTVWAGLRPNEASALLNPKYTRLSEQDGTPILAVYQSKLKNVPKREDRWKYIPLFLPEQRHIVEIIESKVLEELLAKTISKRWPGCYQYAGRKGFHELMVTRYQQEELEVVRWLGHRSLDMALKHYAKRDTVRWKKAA